MKNRLSFIFNLIAAFSLSQSLFAINSTDSLLAEFIKVQDTSKITIGAELTRTLSNTDMSQALNLAKEMLDVAQQSKVVKSIAQSQHILGKLYLKNEESDIALTFLNQAAINYKSIGSLESIVEIENNLGKIYYIEGNFVDALHHFFKADSISYSQNYSGKYRTSTAINSALALSEVGLYDLSNEFYEKALLTPNFESQSGSIYAGLLFNSLERDKLYSANKYFKKLNQIDVLETASDYPERILLEAYYQFLSGDNEEGKKSLIKAEQILESSENSKVFISTYMLLAKVCLIGNENEKSLKYAQHSRANLSFAKNLFRQKKAINIALLAATKIRSTESYALALALDSIDNSINQETGLDILRIVNLQSAFSQVSQVKETVTKESNEKTEEITTRTKAEKIGIMLIFALLMLGVMLFMSIRQMKARQKELEEHKKLLKEKHEKEKKSHKELIVEKDKLLDLVFTKADNLVVLCKVEEDGQIIIKSINQALDLINSNFGLSLKKEQFIGQSIISIVNDFPFFDKNSIEKKTKAAKEAITTQRSVTYETNTRLNSNIVNMEVVIEPILNENGVANHLLYTLKDVSKRVKKERQHIQAILQAEDHERERIAKELHDGLGQNLTAAQLYLDGFLADKEQVTPYDGLFNARKFLNLGLDECRNLSHNLIPKSIGDIGLSETLTQFISDLNKLSKTQIEFNSNLTKTKIPESIALNLYRIAQEAINNALKFSEGTKISVQLLLFEEILTLSIEDNGKGFDKNQALESESFGLRSILNRSEYIDGDVNIDSRPNEGTLISVEINKQRLG